MARLLGPDPSTRLALRFTAAWQTEGLPGKMLTVCTDEACTEPADIATYQPEAPGVPGAAITGSQVRVGDDSVVPLFWFPDGVDVVWAKTRDDHVLRLVADVDARLDAMAAVNARAFGAVGDGVADDTAALAAAIAAVPADGGTVRLPAGTYVTSAALELPSNIVLQGEGQNATILAPNGDFHCLYATGKRCITIRDLKIDGPGSGSGHGIFLDTPASPVTNVCLENLFIRQTGGDGVQINTAVTSTISNVRVEEAGRHGFYLSGTSTSVAFHACYANAAAQIGYWLSVVSYSSMSACAADDCGLAYLLDQCKQVNLSGCGCEETTAKNGQDGTSFKVSAGTGNTLVSCYSTVNAAVAFWNTAGAVRTTFVSCREANPGGGATAGFKTDAATTAVLVGMQNSTANSIAANTSVQIGNGVLGLANAGTATVRADRDLTSSSASLMLSRAGTDRWAIQNRSTAGNDDLYVQNANQGLTAILVEDRATAANIQLMSATKAFGGGVGVVGVANASTVPASNPAGGGVLYAEGGALKWRGSSGTVTTLGPA